MNGNALMKKIIGIVFGGVLAAVIGIGSATYVFESRKAYVTEKRDQRKKAYRGSTTLRKDAGKRAGQAVDAWKDQFNK